ncbi:dockerin type I domain-containing protein [Herbivorax sp. ANBcel31]|uniref:pectate lyase family protein n=1 Tax=Herbivorax sp. ANBcel31 TaxID=3069754 RepID=UPI0027B07124|nr:dockerin type I domain-containing protein [Herbivorax sp. ANBcel31]MDQ2086227.1 dockerin type I domain-containing protein [Herbivorax sp. ANBcel31]
MKKVLTKKTRKLLLLILISVLTSTLMLSIAYGTAYENFSIKGASLEYGDLNGDGMIDSSDLSLLRRYILSITDTFPNETPISSADLNGDGVIDSTDYTLLTRYVLEIIDAFPVQDQPSPDPTDPSETVDFSLVGYADMEGDPSNRDRSNNSVHSTVTGGEGTNPQVVTYGEDIEDALETGNYDGGMILYIDCSQHFQAALLGLMRYHRSSDNHPPHPPVTFYIVDELTPDGVNEFRVEDVENVSIIGDGANGELNGIGIRLIRASNIIIRNLRIYNVRAGEATGLELNYSNNVWIDRNHFHSEGVIPEIHRDYYDELLTIKHTSHNVTVSWNIFEDHYKAILVGHSDSDSAAPDNVTFHHNWFRELNTRVPLNRYATTHMFNNLFEDIHSSGINSRQGAKMRIENNVFRNVGSGNNDSQGDYIQGPIGWWYGSSTGHWHMIDNIIEDSVVDQKVWDNDLSSSNVPYAYEHLLHPVTEVENIVKEYAGRSFEPVPQY